MTPSPSEPTGTVADYPDEDLLRRSVRTIARNKRGRAGRLPAWSRVGNVFGLGSAYSIQLCRRFDVDPDTGITALCVGNSPAEHEWTKPRAGRAEWCAKCGAAKP